MHQCKSISVLSGSSHTFTVHHHIFRQPCDKNCFICSGTHFLCYSLQVQLSDPVIQTVLKNTRAMLLLLQRSLHGDDLKRAHFSQDFQTNCAIVPHVCVFVCVWSGDRFHTFEMSLSFCSFTSMSLVRSWTHSLKTFSLQRWSTWRPSDEILTSGSVRV